MLVVINNISIEAIVNHLGIEETLKHDIALPVSPYPSLRVTYTSTEKSILFGDRSARNQLFDCEADVTKEVDEDAPDAQSTRWEQWAC